MRFFIVAMMAMICVSSAAVGPARGEGKRMEKSFKGWELYSWKAEHNWKYSLLMGTNRLKSCNEIKAKEETLTYEQMLKKLESVAEDDWVTWCSDKANGSTPCGLRMAPANVRQSVERLCEKRRIHLQVME